MKFGIWYDFRNPPRWRKSWASLYGELLEQIAWADGLGFESVWLSEHHFTEDGYMPSVFPVLGAIAQRTRNLRLGTAVLLAPQHHPVRLAEDSAVVDVLSEGRLELGLAPGYRPAEFQILGIPKQQRGKRTDETIEILRLAWQGDEFTYKGQIFQFESVISQPTPTRQTGVPIHVGGSSRTAAQRAGRYCCNFMPDVGSPRTLYELYWEELQRAGAESNQFEVSTNGCVYVCEDPERGWNDIKEHLSYMKNYYEIWASEAGDVVTASSAEDVDDPATDLCIVGTPSAVVERLKNAEDEFGFDRFIFWARLPGLPIEKSNRSLELFANEVLPSFVKRS